MPSAPRHATDGMFGVREDASLEVFELADDPRQALSDLPLPEAAPSGAVAEVEEILRADRRRSAAAAIFPLWGLWRAFRSDVHTKGERLAMGVVSLATTAIVVLAALRLQPSAAEEHAAMSLRVRQDLGVLGTLVENYRKQYGRLPDEEEWKRSSRRRDPRFVDPWGRPYRYETSEDGYRVGTFGADSRPGGTGSDSDHFAGPRGDTAD